jgi:hypothetical protein
MILQLSSSEDRRFEKVGHFGNSCIQSHIPALSDISLCDTSSGEDNEQLLISQLHV